MLIFISWIIKCQATSYTVLFVFLYKLAISNSFSFLLIARALYIILSYVAVFIFNFVFGVLLWSLIDMLMLSLLLCDDLVFAFMPSAFCDNKVNLSYFLPVVSWYIFYLNLYFTWDLGSIIWEILDFFPLSWYYG